MSLSDISEHKHGNGCRSYKHTHAWASFEHHHLLRAVCLRPECRDFPTHNIHHGEDTQAVYEESEDTPYG